jgi:hypothetical protein
LADRRAQQVFAAQQRYQLGVLTEMGVDEVEQLQHTRQRRYVIHLELQLFTAQLAEHVLEHGHVQTVFVTKVVVNHPRIGARALADRVDAGAAVSLGRELTNGRAQEPLARGVWVALRAGFAGFERGRARPRLRGITRHRERCVA